jgi:hypothetical protein
MNLFSVMPSTLPAHPIFLDTQLHGNVLK